MTDFLYFTEKHFALEFYSHLGASLGIHIAKQQTLNTTQIILDGRD